MLRMILVLDEHHMDWQPADLATWPGLRVTAGGQLICPA